MHWKGHVWNSQENPPKNIMTYKDLQMLQFWRNKGNILRDYVFDYCRVGCKYKGPKTTLYWIAKSKLHTNWICQTPVSLFDWPWPFSVPHLRKILWLENHSFWAQSLENLLQQMKGKIAPLCTCSEMIIFSKLLKKCPFIPNFRLYLDTPATLGLFRLLYDTLTCWIGIH